MAHMRSERKGATIMRRFVFIFLSLFLTLLAVPAQAALNVLACEPEWAALVTELAGDKANVSSATSAMQDPHRIEARPSLIARARNADLLVCTGMELEAGWLPVLLQQSANAKIQPGQPGYFEAGRFASAIDIPGRLDRANGDVHAAGNPHIQTDPRNIARVAVALAAALAQIDPAQAAFYQARQKDFAARWSAALARWERNAAPLRGVAVIEHHKNLDYLLNWLGMREVGTLEPKPGLEPSAAQLATLLGGLPAKPARLILRAAYQDGRASDWLAERARIPAVVLPFTVGGNANAKDLFALFDDTIARLLAGLK
jgi:zinc/manganese transport system substrate-binding protein